MEIRGAGLAQVSGANPVFFHQGKLVAICRAGRFPLITVLLKGGRLKQDGAPNPGMAYDPIEEEI